MKNTKRILICLLISVLVICSILPVAARELKTEGYLCIIPYFEKFCGEYHGPAGSVPDEVDIGELYKEVYAHYESEPAQLSWVLVEAAFTSEPAYPQVYRFSCPERLLENGSHDNPFSSGYGIYDVKNDEWMDLSVALQSDRFEGLIEVCNENKIGNIYGDMDCDYTITIVDATMIQRFLADLLSTGNADLIADYDRDGSATVLDATAIQRTLAGFTTEG